MSTQTTTTHRFAIEYSTQEGRRLGQIAVTPEFQPAREAAYFAAVRQGLVAPVTAPAQAEVAPLWDDERGPPYCGGIRLVVRAADGRGEHLHEVPTTFFHELAEERATVYVERGELRAGEHFLYAVCAYPAEERRPAEQADALGGLEIEADDRPVGLAETELDAFMRRSEETGEPDPADAPVFVAAEVLEQTRELAQQAGELETGGALLGRLHRDGARPEVFAEITAQIPAQHASAGSDSYTFTPETWAAADAAIQLRGEGELFLGWWHSHPRFCGKCPGERWRSCQLARPFFSADDVHLHRTCFPRAYQLALLISDLPGAGPTPALFGWRHGSVTSRGYRVLHGRDTNPRTSHSQENP